ncbi:cytochrome c biogenesis CcdA family protein [Exiguobacterium flavidum]|uniref:cytochrome c biogenesis CcdA family protein n=1 Tax=Exiguobacterium flavidum TaxID=2184695 RepID=UPI000DF86215|nr:cytochrome c biogenesis protein CcdA [Exiguobacterium flavidum]
MQDISILFAVAGGLLSFFSPCVFPLLPAYVSHLTGGRFTDTTIEVDRRTLLIRSLGFIAGFSLIFIAFGASASFLGRVLMDYRVLLMQLAGLLIILFGLQMTGLLQFKWLMYEKRIQTEMTPKGFFSSAAIGMAFASGWSPCVGLSLSSILLLAGSTDTLLQGTVLLAAYSIGMAIPFLVVSVVISYSLGFMRRINRHLGKISLFNGVLMIALGFLVLSGQMQKISAILASYSLFN